MLPKILKFGFVIVFIFLAVFISSQNNVAHADTCSQQNIGGTYYWICSDGCVSGSASRWYYYYTWNGSSWVWQGWYTVSDPTCQVNVNNASFISQSVPTTMMKNQSYAVNVTMYNSGNTTWPGGSVYRLGSQNPQDNTTWGLNRAYLAYSVSPGQSYTFSFSVTAPNNAGSYNFQWRMVQDGVQWFGSYSTNLSITVTNPANNGANFLSQSVPTTMDAGTSYSVSVTMRNNGNTTWTSGGLYRLGSINPYDNSTWGLNRVYLPYSIPPGSSYAFPFNVTTPSTPGSYNFQWRMVQDGVQWFGDNTTNLVITILCKPISCYGNPGAGGSCSYGSSKNSLIGTNGALGTAPYTLSDGTVVRGHTVSVCQPNGCYANTCQVYPDDCYDSTASSVYTPMPYYDSNICGTNPAGAGGTCTSAGQTSAPLPCTTSTGQPGTSSSTCRQFPPGAINTSTHYCYTNSCVCTPSGQTKTNQTCDATCNWQTNATNGTSCVANGTCSAVTSAIPLCNDPATATCTPSTCTATCTSSGTMTCTYTKITGATCGTCTQATFQKACSITCFYTISGNVFVDLNRNGIKDAGETSFSGTNVSNGYTGVTTDGSGNYSFIKQSVGTYNVTLTIPSGYSATTTNPVTITLPPNGTVNFGIVPKQSISGNVFIDTNKNGTQDGTEVNYTGTITITASPNSGTITTPVGAGTYTINNLIPGTYTVTYSGIPTGYLLTYPVPATFTVTVGQGTCNKDSYNSAQCDGLGNITNLNFGISNSNPWTQCVGGSCRIDSGFNYKIPSGSYASITGGNSTSPGLVYTGASTPAFSTGQASVPDWTVGGLTYPETYAPPKIGGIVKTSYNYLSSRAREANITPTDILTACGGNYANCTLPVGLSNGVYIANGDLKLNSYTFTKVGGVDKNYIILVHGNLTIAGKIWVDNGSTAVFSASGDITINKTVGETASSSCDIASHTGCTIEGLYSADGNFTAEGTPNICSVNSSDLRLNVAGNIIANAGLSGGSFQNNRDLCGNDTSYPSIAITQIVDLILNSPDFIKQPSYTWQESAP